MDDVIDNILERAYKVSQELNQSLQLYSNLTTQINNLLSTNDEEAIFRIQTALEQRENIIQQYDVLKQEYTELFKMNSTADNFIIGEKISWLELPAAKPIRDTELVRDQLLKAIQKLNEENKIKLDVIYNEHKDKIKHVNEGKKAYNAYHANQPLVDGVYIDKRE